MNPFNRLPGSQRAPPGLEWKVLKKLPAVLLASTLSCAGFILLLQSGWLDMDAEESLKAQYATFGLMLFYWVTLLTVALFCVIIVVMKGPAYVMDPYELSDNDHPKHPDSSRER